MQPEECSNLQARLDSSTHPAVVALLYCYATAATAATAAMLLLLCYCCYATAVLLFYCVGFATDDNSRATGRLTVYGFGIRNCTLQSFESYMITIH